MANKFVTTTFLFFVSDGEYTVNVSITLTVVSVNDLPTIINPDEIISNSNWTQEQNFGQFVLDLSTSGTDVETSQENLKWYVEGLVGFVNVTGNGTNILTFESLTDVTGTRTFTLILMDEDDGTAELTITMEIKPYFIPQVNITFKDGGVSANGSYTILWEMLSSPDYPNMRYVLYYSTTPITSKDDLAGLTPIEVQDGSYIGEGLTNGTYYFVLVVESDYVDSEMSNVLTLEVSIPGPDVPPADDGSLLDRIINWIKENLVMFLVIVGSTVFVVVVSVALSKSSKNSKKDDDSRDGDLKPVEQQNTRTTRTTKTASGTIKT